MKNFLETIDEIEIKEVGKCGNCEQETIYYDTRLKEYVCCRDCGEELALWLNYKKRK